MVVQSGDQQRQCSRNIIGLVLYYIHLCMSEELFISCYYRILAKFVLFEYHHVYSEIESQKRE